MAVVCWKDHPFNGKMISLEELKGENLVAREKGSGTQMLIDSIFTEHRLSQIADCWEKFISTIRNLSAGSIWSIIKIRSRIRPFGSFYRSALPSHRRVPAVYGRINRNFAARSLCALRRRKIIALKAQTSKEMLSLTSLFVYMITSSLASRTREPFGMMIFPFLRTITIRV